MFLKNRTDDYVNLIRNNQDTVFNKKYTLNKIQRSNEKKEVDRATTERFIVLDKSIMTVHNKISRLIILVKGRNIYEGPASEEMELIYGIKKAIVKISDDSSEYAAYYSILNTHEQLNSCYMGIIRCIQARILIITRHYHFAIDFKTETDRLYKNRKERLGLVPSVQKNNVDNTALKINANSTSTKQRAISIFDEQSKSVDFMPLEQFQQTTELDNQFRNERSTALINVESAINDLKTMFSQLPQLISIQGEMVQRIDFNLDQASINLSRGNAQLRRYLRRILGRRKKILYAFLVIIILLIIIKYLYL